MTETLALLGGTPVLPERLSPYSWYTPEEEAAVLEVLRHGTLSGFLGSFEEGYWGGPRVRALEAAWCERFGCRHAVTVNSATSGLIVALGAIGLSPGDEVIVPPFSMSATAVAPLFYGGIPVFVDIEPETFCLDLEEVRAAISTRTRAVIAVNLFGHPARLAELRALCDERGLYLVEDNAQALAAMEGRRYTGTVGHLGVFSLNVHKHIQAGEGGVVTTDDDDLALRAKLIRNHGENAVGPLAIEKPVNLFGSNLRMGELTATIAHERLRRLEEHIARRVRAAERLSEGLRDLPGLTTPVVRKGCTHVYYLWAARYDAEVVGVPLSNFSQALAAEGVPHGTGYVQPLYRLPVFVRRIAMGRDGFPFTLGAPDYTRTFCPVAERLYDGGLVTFEVCAYALDDDVVDRIVAAFHKVHRFRDRLRTT